MLNRLTKIYKPLILHSNKRFGSSHGAPAKIQINKQATWLRYKTTRRLAVVDGVEDTHIPLPDLLDIDPIPHVRNVPWYNVDSMFYGDPYHHDLSHEANSIQEQGYLIADQPHLARFDMYTPGVYAFLTIAGVFILREYSDINTLKPIEELVAEADHVEALADQQLKKKVNKIKALQEQLAQQR